MFDSLGLHQFRKTERNLNLSFLVGFLRGPVWNVPILTFIEHKSLSAYESWKDIL